MAFSRKSYIFLKGTREADGKGNVLVLTFGGDGAAVKLHNFLGNGQTQAGPACGSARAESRRKNCSKIWLSFSGGMVLPRFSTRTDACSPCCSK